MTALSQLQEGIINVKALLTMLYKDWVFTRNALSLNDDANMVRDYYDNAMKTLEILEGEEVDRAVNDATGLCITGNGDRPPIIKRR